MGNLKIEEQFSSVYSVQLYSGLIAYSIDPAVQERPKLLWCLMPKSESASDFQYEGASSAMYSGNLFTEQQAIVRGGRA